MFWFQATLLTVLLCVSVLAVIIFNFENGRQLENQFQDYIRKFNKSYNVNSSEYLKKFINFKKSLDIIDQLNSLSDNPQSATYGITKYSDLTAEEFRMQVLKKSPYNRMSSLKRPSNDYDIGDIDFTDFDEYVEQREKRQSDNIPTKVDWREKGVVSPVQTQGKCGSCWANSVIGTIESIMAIKENASTVVPLSVQQMLDCAENHNHGCDGGDTCNLLEWLHGHRIPIETSAAYPMAYKSGVCKQNLHSKSAKVVVNDYVCKSMIDNEYLMLRYLAKNGPITAAVNAQMWQNYNNGIIQFHCSSDYDKLNHAVEIVGYDCSGEIPYYIVRNSWGVNFGDDGYLKIEIGRNLCGIATQISVVDVVKV